MTVRYSWPIAPPTMTSQQKGLSVSKRGKARAYTKPSVHAAYADVRRFVEADAPSVPMAGPLYSRVTLIYPGPKEEWKITKPDAANVAKGITDLMVEFGYFKDEQIAVETAVKRQGKEFGIEVRLRKLRPIT